MKLLTVIKNIPFFLWMLRHGIGPARMKSWVHEYIEMLPLAGKRTEHHYFLSFIGGYGVGKTTVAKELAERLPFVLLSSDQGRRLLQQRGVSSAIVGNEKLMFLLGFRVVERLLKKHINIILDADLRQKKFHDALRKTAAEHGYEFLLVHITASEEAVRERIAKRREAEESEFLRENMERHFHERKHIHETEPMPKDIFFTIDTGRDLEPQIDALVRMFADLSGSR